MNQGKYSGFVPSIFKEEKDEASFMERYLKIFEYILSGIGQEGIKESDANRIDIVENLFHPGLIKEDFLIFLGRWLGLTLKEGWDIDTKREIIARIIPLYRIRGTKRGLEEYIKIFTHNDVEIIEEKEPFQVEIYSHVGKNTLIGGLLQNYFIVNITLPESDPENDIKRRIIEEMIGEWKPLHTKYGLNIKYIKENTNVS